MPSGRGRRFGRPRTVTRSQGMSVSRSASGRPDSLMLSLSAAGMDTMERQRKANFQCPFRQTKQTSSCIRRRVVGLCMLGRPSPTCLGALIEAATIRP